MANEVKANYESGADLYFFLFNQAGQVWSGSAFVDFSTGSWDSFLLELPEVDIGSGFYFADFPTAITTAGRYWIVIFERLLSASSSSSSSSSDTDGAGPADERIAESFVSWDGSREVEFTLAASTGNYGDGTVGAALSRIGTGNLTIVSIVAASGTVTLVKGDDYTVSQGRALTWTTAAAATWPVLTDATILFRISGNTLLAAGEVVNATGANKSVRVELRCGQTIGLTPGSYSYDLRAILDGSSASSSSSDDCVDGAETVTLARGTLVVLADAS
ncbi:hypothetical protein Pan216_08380 [Planctomycetes bacterium Pan216]|uniref:Uncharacterized protein n=1 Tax=Kolteria novifilia TaxID=2527975 RepID=A0A518AZ40_9BACT|nr:hypothetical protein Pan216_08380 [Planctomycetes bacterium Pan216]